MQRLDNYMSYYASRRTRARPETVIVSCPLLERFPFKAHRPSAVSNRTASLLHFEKQHHLGRNTLN